MTVFRKLSLAAAGCAALAAAAPAKAETAWPDLPVGIKNGIGVRLGDRLFVGLGSAGTGLYALDLADREKGWVKRAAFPGPTTFGAAAAAADGRLYVFSGNGKARPTDAAPILFDTVYTYDPAADRWTELATHTPVGLSGAKAATLSDGRIALLGGYNKQLFDDYLAALTATDPSKDSAGYRKLVSGYMGNPPEFYRWNPDVLTFDPASAAWNSLGKTPGRPTCDSALVPDGPASFTLLGGEIKPGLRTTDVAEMVVDGTGVHWKPLPPVPPAAAGSMAEGVSGAFAGRVGDAVVLAGGANFPGAAARAAAGQWFVNDGLTKTWRSEVYALERGEWHAVGQLPVGLAYGVSFTLPEGVLLVGGEDKDGVAHRDVELLTLGNGMMELRR